MMDLLSLAVSMGMQSEMKELRTETGELILNLINVHICPCQMSSSLSHIVNIHIITSYNSGRLIDHTKSLFDHTTNFTISLAPGTAFNDNVEVAEESTMSQVAEVVESGLNAIESAVSSVAAAMTPSGAMVESVMPSAAYVEMDLSMPTSSTTSTKAC